MPDEPPIGSGPFGDTPEDPARRQTANMIADAMGQGVAVAAAMGAQDNDPGEANADGIGPGEWTPNPMTGLPEDCPVVPLGFEDDTYYIFTARGTMTAFSGKVSELQVASWFAPRTAYMCWMAPPPKTAGGKDRNPKNFQYKDIVMWMMNACVAKGTWSPLTRIRGSGGWVNGLGHIVYNFGDAVLSGDDMSPNGEIDGILYPKRRRMPRPAPRAVAQSPGGGPHHAMRNFESWVWTRDEAPRLLLGQIGLAFLGGVWRWRPHIYARGRKGSGKTLLQETVRLIMGQAMFGTEITSAAGITQAVGYDCIAVGVDEAEGTKNPHKMSQIMELARISSSGGVKTQGTQDGKGTSFSLHSCFFMTGISSPQMESQDIERWCVLNMRHHKERHVDIPDPVSDGTVLADWGRQILRRMIDHYPRFQEVHQIYKAALSKPEAQGGAGLDNRLADQQYGHLIAAQHILLSDHAPTPAEIEFWVSRLRRDASPEYQNETDNWQDCLDYMLDKAPDMWRTKSCRTVRSVLQALFEDDLSDADFDMDMTPPPNYDGYGDSGGSTMGWKRARSQLNDLGITLINGQEGGIRPAKLKDCQIHVPSKHPGLFELFRGSNWDTKTAGNTGPWHGLLEQAPDDLIVPKVNAKFGGKSRYGHKLHVGKIMDFDGRDDRRPEA